MEYPSKNISLDFLLAQVLSVFTISLALGAYVRRNRIPEEERFVVALDDLYENRNTKKNRAELLFDEEDAKRKGFYCKRL